MKKHRILDYRPEVALISNCIDENNRQDQISFLGPPIDGFFNPLEYELWGVKGIIIPLDFISSDIFSSSGMREAKKHFISAVKYTQYAGVKIVLLAASTKRIFGSDGKELKELFPDIIFTIGDNGTTWSMLRLLEHLSKSLDESEPIIVLGAGFLGEQAIKHLKGRNLFVVSKHLKNPDGFELVKTLAEVPTKTRLLVVCTHNHKESPEALLSCLMPGAMVMDVGVPPGFTKDVYDLADGKIMRFDAGDYLLEGLTTKFNPKLMGLGLANSFHGCFAEASFLSFLSKEELLNHDFFLVNDGNMSLVKKVIKEHAKETFIPLMNYSRPILGLGMIEA